MISDPVELWLLRHGQSLGNVARDGARTSHLEVLDIAERDMDVPLSPLGAEQAGAFGAWMRSASAPPQVVISSPYVRATQTAGIAVREAGFDLPVHSDERLRERELGVLDLLTTAGVQARQPFEAERRRRLGKFYHRPPGGESWVDVALRVRSLRDSLAREHLDKRVLLVTHEVVIVIWRYLLDDLDEAGALALARDHPLANCSLTTYVRGRDDNLAIDRDGWTAPLERSDVTVTEAPDAPGGAPLIRSVTVVLDADALRAWPISEPADADKFSRGTVLVIGGSPSTPGAVILAGIATLRMGTGCLRIVTAADIAGHVGAVVPEAMVIGVPSTAHGLTTCTNLEDACEGVGAVVFGPGMTGDRPPTSLLADVVELVGGTCPMVVDAAGLDAFVGLDQTTRMTLREQVVMTPNRQEVCRLAGVEDVGHDELMAQAARRTGAVLTSFGLVLTPDGRAWRTSARPIGLGTSGTGDVLAGLVGGGVARCGDLVQGTCWATYAHMEAGARLDTTVGLGYLARELPGQVPALLAMI